MNSKSRICISSPPDREKLVAEIFFGDEQWGELNQEHSSLILEIYPRRDGKPWVLKHAIVVSALREAEERLRGTKYRSLKTDG